MTCKVDAIPRAGGKRHAVVAIADEAQGIVGSRNLGRQLRLAQGEGSVRQCMLAADQWLTNDQGLTDVRNIDWW